MKIYNVIYIHATEADVCDFVIPFLDMEDAAKCYEGLRQTAIETARDDDPDSDEEVFRDLDIKESRYHFKCRVPEDKEIYVVRIDESDTNKRKSLTQP